MNLKRCKESNTPLKIYCDNCKTNNNIENCFVDCDQIGIYYCFKCSLELLKRLSI